MIKKWLFLAIIFNFIFVATVAAKAKECLVKPLYDIIINSEQVSITNPKHSLVIAPNGIVTLDGQLVDIRPEVQLEAKQFQIYLRQKLPAFEQQAYSELNDVRSTFEKAIRERLGNSSELLKNLNDLYTQLLVLLHRSIMTNNDVTYFYYQPFNNLKKDGEAIGKKVFYKVIRDSIFHFDVFKNYSAIKKIAKQEWQAQKLILKAFDDDVCALITDIDNRYNNLMIDTSL